MKWEKMDAALTKIRLQITKDFSAGLKEMKEVQVQIIDALSSVIKKLDDVTKAAAKPAVAGKPLGPPYKCGDCNRTYKTTKGFENHKCKGGK